MPHIQLIKAPLDDGSFPEDRWYLPLDLLAVASAAEVVGSKVSILDGGTMGFDQIAANIGVNTDLVGLTYSALSVRNFALLGQISHDRGVRTVVGGQAATASAESLVREPFVDLVVVGDGEPAIREMVAQLRAREWLPAKIPNGVAQGSGGRICGPAEMLSIREIGRFARDAGGVQPEVYLGSFEDGNTLKNIDGSRATNIFSKRGCAARCSFCARTDKRIRARDPHEVIDEIVELSKQFELDYIIDTSDTWISKLSWVREFCAARRSVEGLLPSMMVFADSRHVKRGVPELLVEAGIDNILLGIESASERVLLRNGKPNSRKHMETVIESLVSVGIRVSVSFVLGLLGEDDASLAETRRFADDVGQLSGVRCYCNVIMPLPGSPAWAEFMKDERGRKWERVLDYEVDAVRQDFVEAMTSVSGGAHRLLRERDAILEQNDLPQFEFAR